MSARIKPHKVRGRELEEVREKDPRGGARDAGGAGRVRRGQASLLKEAEQVPIITVDARSSCG
jgi:hypothetical protein